MTVTTQLVDGTWEITYDVVVTNTGDRVAAVYSLDGRARRSAATSRSTTHRGPARRRAALRRRRHGDARHRPRARPGGVDTYTVTAHATVDEAAWSGDTLTCDRRRDPPAAGGFLNVATVTVNGTDDPGGRLLRAGAADDREGRGRRDAGPGRPDRWLVSYNVTVTSGGYDTFYSLSDTPAFAGGHHPRCRARLQRTDIPGQPVLTITSGTDFVTGVALPAGAMPRLPRVVGRRHRPMTADPDDADCTGQPGSGFFNTATLTVGRHPDRRRGLHPRRRPRLPDGHQDRDVDEPGSRTRATGRSPTTSS